MNVCDSQQDLKDETLGKTHLEFYRQHQIAPVSYNLEDINAHLQRRESLYLKLGLPPIAFRYSSILEVAAGLGHNSLYLAHMMPKQLVLLEPNPVGIKEIQAVYNTFDKVHTSPIVLTSMLEDYFPENTFDIVLCENWLGTSKHEISLLQKLSRMVSPKGILVLTTVSPIGFVPNLIRRFLAVYAAPFHAGFEKRTELLIKKFSSHLDTLKSMTRNKIDWVHDNLINPAYFGLCLSIPKVIEQLDTKFDVIGSNPSFTEDWRWFKSLHGNHRQFNQHFLSDYWRKAHNFLDYREPITQRDPELNIALEKKATLLLQAIEMHEEAHAAHGDIATCSHQVFKALDDFLAFVPNHFINALRGLSEIQKLKDSIFRNKSFPNMKYFPDLFGRETVYISLSLTK